MGKTYINTPDLFGGMAEAAKTRAAGYSEAAGMLSEAASRPMTAWEALKAAITGAGAEAWLLKVMTNTMSKTGRIMLTPMLNENGKIIGDFTIAKAAENRFMMWGSSQAQVYHMRWFEQYLPKDGSVKITPYGMKLIGLSIAGPKSRELLQRLTGDSAVKVETQVKPGGAAQNRTRIALEVFGRQVAAAAP